MVKYKNTLTCKIIVIVDGKLRIINPGEIVEANQVIYGLELKPIRENNGDNKTNNKSLRK